MKPFPRHPLLPNLLFSDNQAPAQWKVLIRSQLFAQSLNKPSLPVAQISCPGFGVCTQGLSTGSSLCWGSFGPQKWPDWQPVPPKRMLTKAGSYSRRETPDPWGDSGVLYAVWGENLEFQICERHHGVRRAEAKTLPLHGSKKLQHRSQNPRGIQESEGRQACFPVSMQRVRHRSV